MWAVAIVGLSLRNDPGENNLPKRGVEVSGKILNPGGDEVELKLCSMF